MKGAFQDGTIPEEVYQELETKIHEAASRPSIFRQMFPGMFSSQSLNWKQELAYDTSTDMSAARMDTMFQDIDVDQEILTRAYKKVIKIEKGFKIDRWTLENAEDEGYGILQRHILNAAKKIGETENEFLLVGYKEDGTNIQVPFQGLYEQANNDFNTTSDFGTNGKPTAATKGGVALLEADYEYGPYKLILNPVQNLELATSMDAYGNMEQPQVNAILNTNSIGWMSDPNTGTMGIGSNPWMTAGKGLMIADDPDALTIYPGQDLKIDLHGPEYNNGKYLVGRVYRTEVLVIYRTNALCKLSDI